MSLDDQQLKCQATHPLSRLDMTQTLIEAKVFLDTMNLINVKLCMGMVLNDCQLFSVWHCH